MADRIAKAHELDIANRFIEFLKQCYGAGYGPAEASEAPDALARDPDGNIVGIEVTCSYYSSEEAKNTWEIARGRPERSTRYVRSIDELEEKLKSWPLLVNFTQNLIHNAQQQINEHCLRSYPVPTYLLVDLSHAPLDTAEQAPLIVPNLCVPNHSRFLSVYVGLTRNFTSQVEFFPVTQPCV